MARDDAEYWKSKSDSLERRLEEERVGTRYGIAAIAGCVIYAAFGMSWGGGLLGLAIALAIISLADKKRCAEK